MSLITGKRQRQGNNLRAAWDCYGMDSTYAPGAKQQNLRGEWVPLIPRPLRALLWHQCGCGERFISRRRYQGHYALAHILALDI